MQNILSKSVFQFYVSRFVFVRKIYSRYKAFADNYRPLDGQVLSEIFGVLDTSAIVKALKEDAVWQGLSLPETMIREIHAFSVEQKLEARLSNRDDKLYLQLGDINNGRLANGEVVPLAYVCEPEKCKSIKELIHDPALNRVVSDFLCYVPRSIIVRLYWSFAGEASDVERRASGQTFEFHYDVNGFNFLYVSFYLTDTDENNGAHVMVKGSNKAKPWSMLFPSVRAADKKVYDVFGKENELVIRGEAGKGFVQDASCYHKAPPPVKRDRLMLQLRYS